MKRYITTAIIMAFLLVSAAARAQGVITTVVGCLSCPGSTAEGVPATTATLSWLTNVFVDTAENIYLTEGRGYKVRWVNAATQRIYTLAGNGTFGFSGDGGPATAAQLSGPEDVSVDRAGNLYIADFGSDRIRFVNRATGIISTYAGGGTSTAEGAAATATAIAYPRTVFVDAANNCYYGENGKLRKIDAVTRQITTVAGTGVVGDDGDGGPATNAKVSYVRSIVQGRDGNIYFTSGRGVIRKVDITTNIISTIAGGGGCELEGVPGVVDSLGATGALAIDSANNFIAGSFKMKVVLDSNKYVYSIAGDGTTTADGAGAFDTRMYINSMAINATNTSVYFVDISLRTGLLRKLTYVPLTFLPPPPTDSFSVNIAPQCSGPRITFTTDRYRSGMTVKTWFGDGQTSVQPVVGLIGCSAYGSAIINHIYAYSGTYTLKQVLYVGTTVIDSTIFTYNHIRCNDFKVNFYIDGNGNCQKDGGDVNLLLNAQITVDSAGIPVDTINAISGFYYRAYGAPGTIYTYRLYYLPPGYVSACPSTGVIYDTIRALSYNLKQVDFGLTCSTVPGFDLSVTSGPTFIAPNWQEGSIFVNNATCNPMDVDVLLTYSPKYTFTGRVTVPPATSFSGNTITWHLTGVAANLSKPIRLYYNLQYNPTSGPLTIGDTVHTEVTISPSIGDMNIANNDYIRIDTVRLPHDPNYVDVSPAGCLHPVPSPIQMQYTVHFENTGNDTAHNIYVMDTLSNNLDLSTLEILSASAEMNVTTSKNVGGHHILKFDFPGINLPDSSHHGLADGSVIYRIKTKASLPRGAALTNRAGIYFDYNDVVMTNTALNDIGCNLSAPNLTMAKSVDIYPNPASDMLTIKTVPGAYAAFTISNAMGQHVVLQTITSAINTVDVKAMPAGIYYIILTGEQGRKVEKFVKW